MLFEAAEANGSPKCPEFAMPSIQTRCFCRVQIQPSSLPERTETETHEISFSFDEILRILRIVNDNAACARVTRATSTVAQLQEVRKTAGKKGRK